MFKCYRKRLEETLLAIDRFPEAISMFQVARKLEKFSKFAMNITCIAFLTQIDRSFDTYTLS